MTRGVRGGRLKDRLDIQTATETSGPYGAPEYTWTTAKSRACEIRPLRGVEFSREGVEGIENTYEIRFRYEKGLFNEASRLLDTRTSPNRIFDIEGIVNTGNWDREYVVTAVNRPWPDRA